MRYNEYGYTKKNNAFKHFIIPEILSLDSEYKLCVYNFIPDYIKDMEKEIWEENSDPDFNDIPIWNCYVIENKFYVLGYIIISKRYFIDGDLSQEIYDPSKISSFYDSQKGLDIEDFVVLNMRKAFPLISKAIESIFNDIKEYEPNFIVMNPNRFSKAFVKRLDILNIPIKYYNYPKYSPNGYISRKDERSQLFTSEVSNKLIEYFNSSKFLDLIIDPNLDPFKRNYWSMLKMDIAPLMASIRKFTQFPSEETAEEALKEVLICEKLKIDENILEEPYVQRFLLKFTLD